MRSIIKTITLAELVSAPHWAELLNEYAQESAIPGLAPHNPQMETYQLLEDKAGLKVLGAYLDGELVGFLVLLVHVLPHFGVKAGISESLFVARHARTTGAGLQLIREAQRLAKESGAEGFFVSAPVDSRLQSLLPMIGFNETSRVFFKPLTAGLIVPEPASLPAMSQDAVEAVSRFEELVLTQPQAEIVTSHLLHAGMYARTVMIPKGVMITGALIKLATTLIIDGYVEVFTGEKTLTLIGHHVIPASAGRKQVFLAHADTHITMLFPSQAASVEEAETEFTDEAERLLSRKQSALESVTITGEGLCLEF